MCLWIQFFFVLALFFHFVGVIPGLALGDFHHGTFTAEAGSAMYTCSCAAFQWYLHHKGLRPLPVESLGRIRKVLSIHHSKDLHFLDRLSKEMSQQKPMPWRCRFCQKTAKLSMPRCAWCGRTWQEVMDTSFRPQTPRSGKSQQNRAHTPPGQGQQPPGQGRQQTLRRRSRKGNKNQGQQMHRQGLQFPCNLLLTPSYTRRAILQTSSIPGPYAVPHVQGPSAFVQHAVAPPPPPPVPCTPNNYASRANVCSKCRF